MRRIVALAAILALGGCVTTAPVEFYLPHGAGELIDVVCVPGPPHTLRVVLAGGAELRVAAAPASVYPTAYPQIMLSVRLIVPADTTFRVTAADVRVTSAVWPISRPVPIAKVIDLNAGRAFPPLATLPGLEGTAGRPYQLSFADVGPRDATRIAAVDAFKLELPALEVGGRWVDVAPIAFKRQTWHGMHLVCD